MPDADRPAADHVNLTRHRASQAAGHYESFFLRANHPTRPLAFWIRYTLFSPQGRPRDAVGELWAIYFDGERQRHVAVKQTYPLGQCVFDPDQFRVQVADAQLGPGALHGCCAAGGHTLAWNLAFAGDSAPLLLLQPRYYAGGFPKAKSLVGLPSAVFRGALVVDGTEVAIDDWVGSQNHNWGQRHTDFYAWGQVAGFDTHPESFLEVASARLKYGPLWTPFITPIVLRHRGDEIRLNGLWQALRTRAALTYFTWTFEAETRALRLEGTITAPPAAFVGLAYANPPGGVKHCLNSKIAACTLKLTIRHSRHHPAVETLSAAHRAAFEILTDDRSHGITVLAP